EVADASVPPLPQHLVVRIDVRGGEVAADPDARLLRGHGHGQRLSFSPVRLWGSEPQHVVVVPSGSPEMRGTFHHRNYTGVKRSAGGNTRSEGVCKGLQLGRCEHAPDRTGALLWVARGVTRLLLWIDGGSL